MAGRSSFGPVVVLGLAAGTLVAVAGNQAWAAVAQETDGASERIATTGAAVSEATAPLVTAVALVLLATWGVVLVTRGLVRRLLTWAGLLAALGMLAAAVAAWVVAPREVSDGLEAAGLLDPDVSRTAWAYVAVVASVVGVLASGAAVRGVAGWPEMGRRYDAPGEAAAPADVPLEDQTNLDLWRAMDDGRDPTDRPGPPGGP